MTGVFGAVGVVGDLAVVAAGEGLAERFAAVVSREVEIADGRGCLESPLADSALLACFISAGFPSKGLFPTLLFTGIFTDSCLCEGLGGAIDFFSAGEGSNAEPLSREPKPSVSSRDPVAVLVFSDSGAGRSFGAVGSSDDKDALSPSRLEVCSVVDTGSVNNG